VRLGDELAFSVSEDPLCVLGLDPHRGRRR
jgi:hypothetical protein